ncbi:hypothetical protein TNCV_4020231 [Trichonephila clavipes]|nr:hypothetical protein TNCV_4020231 [Trichonephila clavipes]
MGWNKAKSYCHLYGASKVEENDRRKSSPLAIDEFCGSGFDVNIGYCRSESMMLGMAKVEFNILLSGMMAIGWAMESGRRGYGSSSG